MDVVVDTNVPLAANRAAPQATERCVAACARELMSIQETHTLVLDDAWEILKEYMAHLRSEGQPGVGDAFLRWTLRNRGNPDRCTLVHITPEADSFSEFPKSSELAGFDLSDHKYVAVAIVHPNHPPILNATDSDWWHYREALNQHGVSIQFVCPDIQFKRSGT